MIKKIDIITGQYRYYKESCCNDDLLIYYSSPYGNVDIEILVESVKINGKLFKGTIIDSKVHNSVSKYSFNESIDFKIFSENKICINDFLEKHKMINFHKKSKSVANFILVKLFIVGLKFLLKDILSTFFVDIPSMAIQYIKDQPMGIKQNTVIKENLGVVFHMMVYGQTIIYKYLYLLSLVTDFDKFFVQISIKFIFKIHAYILSTLLEILGLFRNRTYNKIKKRFDTVKLSIDQIIMSVLLFSVFLLTYVNIICYYIFYLILYMVYLSFDILEDFIFMMLYDFGRFYYYDIEDSQIKEINLRVKLIIIKRYIRDMNRRKKSYSRIL
ncbi:hypothetical protein P3W45_000036 [Vairimorpha bombi]|jgi:hypothetical protein